MRHKTFFASIVRFPDRHGPIPPGSFPGKVDKICGGHGQGETPGPIPNPEAKALHGDGTAPERVWESSAPPLSHDTVPPGRAPTGSRGVPRFFPTAPRPVIPAFISPHIHSYPFGHPSILSFFSFLLPLPISIRIHSSVHPFLPFPPPFPPHIHSYSFIPSLSVHPSCGRGDAPPARTEAEGHGPRRTRRVARRAPHAPARARRRDGRARGNGEGTAGRRPWFI